VNRIPRTLDCDHAFYFCEECLKTRYKVQCGICRRWTLIKQILAPRDISNKSYNEHSFSFYDHSDDEQDNNDDNNIGLDDGQCSQFATLPTKLLSERHGNTKNDDNMNGNHRCESFHKLFTSPLKHYKHHNIKQYSSTSEPIKNVNSKKLSFEYDDIVNLQKDIITLKNELDVDQQYRKVNDCIDDDIHFMKKQIVELLMEKEKMNKKCNDMKDEIEELKEKNMKLTQQNIKQEQELHALRNKYTKNQCNELKPIKLQCQKLSNEIKIYKESLINNTFKRMTQYIDDEMNEILTASKQLISLQRQSVFEYNKEVVLRRKYFNEIQELKGSIRVYCRIRPLLQNEIDKNYTMKVHAVDNFKVNIEKNKENDRNKSYKKTFEFDRVFPIKSTQDEVFNETKDLVTCVLDGYNVCIFAYGQTGSGKTYTMEGINNKTVLQLFDTINQRRSNYKYTMKVNMLEIYNEKIKDLLVQNNLNESEKDLKRKAQPTYLKIRGDDKTGIHIDNLSQLNCDSIDDVYKALDIGYKNRSFGVTDMNQHSSRSHCVLTINVEGMHFKSGIQYFSKLNLIDLAGSERVKLSNVTGAAMKEAQCINKSLSSLGNVLESIKANKQYIPYRDSKLTFLLKDSIGNNAKTLMMVNVSCCSKDVNETLTSLLFADRVRNVALGKSVKHQIKSSNRSSRRSSISSVTST